MISLYTNPCFKEVHYKETAISQCALKVFLSELVYILTNFTLVTSNHYPRPQVPA